MIIKITKFICEDKVGYILHHVNKLKQRGYQHYDCSKSIISYDGYSLSTSLYNYRPKEIDVMSVEISEEFDILDSEFVESKENNIILQLDKYKKKYDVWVPGKPRQKYDLWESGKPMQDIIDDNYRTNIHNIFMFEHEGPNENDPFMYNNQIISDNIDNRFRKFKMTFTNPTTGEKIMDEIVFVPKFEEWKSNQMAPFVKIWVDTDFFPRSDWIYPSNQIRLTMPPSTDIIIPANKIKEVIEIANRKKIKIGPYNEILPPGIKWPEPEEMNLGKEILLRGVKWPESVEINIENTNNCDNNDSNTKNKLGKSLSEIIDNNGLILLIDESSLW